MYSFLSLPKALDMANMTDSDCHESLGKAAVFDRFIPVHEKDTAWMYDWKVLTSDYTFQRYWRQNYLYTSICIDNTQNQTFPVTVTITVNGNQDYPLFQCSVNSGTYVVHELATCPIPQPAYMVGCLKCSYRNGGNNNAPPPRILVRVCYCVAMNPLYFHGPVLTADDLAFLTTPTVPQKWMTAAAGCLGTRILDVGLPYKVDTVHQVRKELQNWLQRQQTLPFYKWMPLRDWLLLCDDHDDPRPEIVSSLLVMNKHDAVITLKFSGAFQQHDYLVYPGVNVFDLFWNEMYHPPRNMFQGFLQQHQHCDILVRVGWLPPFHTGFPSSIYIAPQQRRPWERIHSLVVYNQNGSVRRRVLSGATEKEIVRWFFFARDMFRGNLADFNLALLVADYLG